MRWTLQFSADRLVALTRLDSLSHEAVRLVLKNNLKPWQRQKWCIPTIIGAKFVWRMEDVMDLYAELYQPAFPVICFDEVPYQMVSETWLPLPMRNGIPGRYDFEYRREDTCNLLMLLQPLAGWRHVKVTDQRSKQDFAWCMQDLVEIHFPEAEKIRSQEGSQVFGANEIGAWECERNAHRATNDWRFTIPNARDKVKKLYPVSEE